MEFSWLDFVVFFGFIAAVITIGLWKSLSHLLTRQIFIEADLIDQIFNSTEKRLARALLLLAGVDNRPGSSSIIPRVTHETLAQMIGATRAQVSNFMSQFKKKGYIKYNGEIEVHESLADFAFKD